MQILYVTMKQDRQVNMALVNMVNKNPQSDVCAPAED